MKLRPLIIAEIGVNHNGSVSLAKKLVLGAKRAGANAVKFQYFKADDLVTKKAEKALYQKKNTKIKKETQFEMLKKVEFNFKKHLELVKFAKKNKIFFSSSFFHHEDIKLHKKLKLDFIKIPSGEINNFLYLNEISKIKDKYIFISTGMATLEEIKETLSYLLKKGLKKKKLILMHLSEYPVDENNLNLRVLNTFKKRFNISTGFSDHSKSFISGGIAVSQGAYIIEKHITLDNKMYGPDHKASLNLRDFEIYCKNIYSTIKILGKSKKLVSNNEKKNKKVVRKSVVAKKDIKKGEKFTLNNLTLKRPGYGLPSKKLNLLLNRKSKRNFKVNDLIIL